MSCSVIHTNAINAEYTRVLMEYGANQRIANVYEYGEQCNCATMNGTKGYYMCAGRGSVAIVSGICGLYMVSYNCSIYGELTINSNVLINTPYQYNAEYTDPLPELLILTFSCKALDGGILKSPKTIFSFRDLPSWDFNIIYAIAPSKQLAY